MEADRAVALERECAQLRAENARLTRLLDLRGQDIRADSEQLAAPTSPPGLVTMSSPPGDKVALFASLFRGRTDKHAVRWQNDRLGTKGWVPHVVGGWRKGMTPSTARSLPLTRDVIAQHLAGEPFIGIYPMLDNNTCHFLAADFDDATAMLDALAYVKAAAAGGVSTALEISQSGRGAHVWIFFTGPAPAAEARAVGTAFLHEAVTMRGSMDLRSYDRLFPSQDVLPTAGPGNLIAAPLNGKRRADGLTLFLDIATLEPYRDQWEYLSTVPRTTPRQIAKLARRSARLPVGADVARIGRSKATAVHPRLPAKVTAELGARLVINTSELPPAAVSAFKHAASMANPRFYELQRLRKSTWGVPRFVQGYDVLVDGSVVLPRGLRHAVATMLEAGGSRLAVTDGRDAGCEIDVTFAGTLRGAQQAAVSAMLAHDDGILVAPPGSGKTVMACAVIAERATSTVVLVDRKALADQWRERVAEFIGVKAGQLGGGRTKLTGVVDVMMLPSLARRDDVAELTAGYGQVIADECHHLAAAVYDHSIKNVAAQFWLGLTATPKRRDGLQDLVTWQLGPVRHVLDDSDRGTLLEGNSDFGGGRGVASRALFIHETSFDASDVDVTEPGGLAEVQRLLATDATRNEQIVADIDAAAKLGRNCLVLTRRVAHLEILADLLRERGHESILMQGGMTTGERRSAVAQLAAVEAGGGIVVVGTTPFIGEGFDAPALDTLFLAAPISYDGLLVQCAGRILRAFPGKADAIVHDYVDAATPVLAASLTKRMPGYRALGFTR
ncbi:MAG TPA: DEAD/DEAH box helicase family protein [Steroidobacteraceae bacterium]